MVKRKLVERPYANGKMTKAAFFGMIRSALRRVKWTPKYEALADAKRKLKLKKGNQRFEYKCNICKKWFKGSEVQVDHIIPCGSLKDWEDLVGFAKKLYCDAELLQVVCKPCHQKITNEERIKNKQNNKK